MAPRCDVHASPVDPVGPSDPLRAVLVAVEGRVRDESLAFEVRVHLPRHRGGDRATRDPGRRSGRHLVAGDRHGPVVAEFLALEGHAGPLLGGRGGADGTRTGWSPTRTGTPAGARARGRGSGREARHRSPGHRRVRARGRLLAARGGARRC
ncbi:hypothetical protein Cus16_1530 [Curtobacterium sp. ER1/6]|nr:hypothetical protein Cus16_1530 [Curtobacterium sp. ER1/6]